MEVKKPEPTLSLTQLDSRSSLPIPHHLHSSHSDRNTHSSHASSNEREDESLTLPSLYPFNISALYKGRWISNPNHRMTNTSSGVNFEQDEGTIVYRLRSLPIPSELRDLIYIDGEMIIHDGIYTTNHDLHYILHGMYQPKTGELHVFANWPDWNSKDNLKRLNVTGSAVKALNESIMENQNNQVDEHDKRYAPFCVTQMAFRLDTLPPNEASEAEPSSDDAPSDDSDYIADPDNVHLPHRVMNGIIKSDSDPSHCLFRIDVIDASIVRNDIFYAKAINYAIMAGAAALIQIALSKKQMEYAASSSRAAKMSLLTIGQQALLDSYLLLFHLVTGILIDALFSAFMTTAFIQFVIFSIFEMRLMLILWKSRRPDAFNQGWERMRRELSILYMRFYGFLVIGLIIIYKLHALLHYFVFIIYSFWTCQIIFNLIHDTNRALLPSYIIGISFTRLLIPLYLLICPVNFLNQSPNINVGIGLTCYVIITALILLAQDRWGPRFFVPKAFLPAKYDYHRAIPMVSLPRPDRNGYAPVAVNSINTTPVTTTTETTPEAVTVPVADDAEEIICAICYCEFDPNARLTDTMVCPCDHYFHTPCLTRWMEQKMECPTCRRALPPV